MIDQNSVTDVLGECVDITYTVKASVANGRRLMRNLLTGEQYWEPANQPDPVDAGRLETVKQAPSPKPKKTRAKKSAEGDK